MVDLENLTWADEGWHGVVLSDGYLEFYYVLLKNTNVSDIKLKKIVRYKNKIYEQRVKTDEEGQQALQVLLHSTDTFTF